MIADQRDSVNKWVRAVSSEQRVRTVRWPCNYSLGGAQVTDVYTSSIIIPGPFSRLSPHGVTG